MIEQLKHDGIVTLGSLTHEQGAEIYLHLLDKPIYLGGHVKRTCTGMAETRDFIRDKRRFYRHSLACYDFDAIVTCPHLIKVALDHADLAEEYLEQEPVVYSANIWWSFPGGFVNPEVQKQHRDVDDEKFLALYFYLSDVDREAAHVYCRGSHRGDTTEMMTITGPAGTMFIEDGSGCHYGNHPSKRPRLAAWVRFGVSDPPSSYKVDGLYPVKAPALWDCMNEKQRRMTRLIVRDV